MFGVELLGNGCLLVHQETNQLDLEEKKKVGWKGREDVKNDERERDREMAG